MLEEEGERPIDYMYEQVKLIMNSINADDNLTMMNETDMLLKTLSEKFKKEHNLLILSKDIQKILSDKDQLRMLRIIQKVKNDPESCIEYYDDDRGSDHRLFYRDKIENEFFKLQEKIRLAMSKIMKHKLQEEIDFT